MKPYYLTTPIYYVNDKPHIGHAYTTIAADVLARWKRMNDVPVFFLTGTDEHGSKIAQAAGEKGQTPQIYADNLMAEFRSLWVHLNIANDDFIRTTETRHTRGVQVAFKKLFDQGDIYKGYYEDWYCVSCESFWLGSDLKDNKCPDCGRAVEKLKEESYFFKLSKYAPALLDHYHRNPLFLSPKYRAQEIINFVTGGLKDISVSRLKESWGVPVPMDAAHSTYVWFDALLNYITALGYGSEANESALTTAWPCDVHIVGKEIMRFHAVIWPAMLMALGLELPKKIFAHGWWTREGEKMSKSKGNIAVPKEITDEYGVDGLRYFLMREIPFGADGDFSGSAIRVRYNAELANDLGNLFSRTLTLIVKHFAGTLNVAPAGALLRPMADAHAKVVKGYEEIAIQDVLEALRSVVSEANRYLDQKAPWTLIKTDRIETEKVLAEVWLVLRWLAAGFYPFMPATAEKMWALLGETIILSKQGGAVLSAPQLGNPTLIKVERSEPLFPRKA